MVVSGGVARNVGCSTFGFFFGLKQRHIVFLSSFIFRVFVALPWRKPLR